MPLIVVCGVPGSGKTRRSQQIADHLTNKHKCKVVIVNEENLGINKKIAYSSSHEQKIARGKIKFEVEKNLINNVVVIADSLNYIKGYRYQMFCIAREQKATYCVVYCNSSFEKAKLNNDSHQNNFSEEMLLDYNKRMEAPQLNQRWDVPLFERREEQQTPVQEIANVILFETKKSKDPVSTKQDEKLSEDYLYQIDKICQEVCEEVSLGKLKMKNNWVPIQARKVKNDFVSIIREKPIPIKTIRDSFILYFSEADKRK